MLTVKPDYSTYPNYIYTFLIVITVVAGLGTLIFSIVLAIINPQENPVKVKIFRFNAIDQSGSECRALAVLELLEHPNSKLRIELNDQSYSAISTDAFSALNKIRKTTDELGIQFLIQGTRPNCWPSGISGQMSNGTKCYLHEMKLENHHSSDLVRTFDSVDKSDVGTLREQIDFQEKWVEAIKNSR